MKRLIKKLVRTLWRTTAPIRQPLVSRFDQHLTQLLRPLLVRQEPSPDIELALRSVVRELARLQMQVRDLQQQVDELQSNDRNAAHTERRLSVVGEID
jgi:uncharacterized protein YlxW (UPF0749 family)